MDKKNQDKKLFSRIDLGDAAPKAKAGDGDNKKKSTEDKPKRGKNPHRKNGGYKLNRKKTKAVSKKDAESAAKKPAAKAAPTQPAKAKPEKKAEKKSTRASKANDRKSKGSRSKSAASNAPALRIIPLGGLEEVGKNMTLYECGSDAFIVDCGLLFPDEDLFGVDIVIPDFSYLVEIQDKIHGLFITHAHEDHIGAIPYLLKALNVPIYGTKLALGLIRGKLAEHGLENKVKMIPIQAGDHVKVGCMSIEPVRVNHSIPDAVAFAVTTPQGVVIQTGDFKVDYTPVFDKTIDLVRFGQLGSEGVLALLSDSTNAEKPGSSATESGVGNALESLFSRAEGKRLIIASFASNIQRVQQIIDLAKRHGRKISLSGRSMITYTNVAAELGYLKVDEGQIIPIEDVGKYRPSDLIIITTGSQGEPMSALSRMAMGTHRQVHVGPDDMIIISATPIPGNEKTVTRVINDLLKLGSDVIYESMYEVHASGHACQDELKLMMQLTKPKYFMPVHGEYKHLVKHANIAKSIGIADGNIILTSIGHVIEFKDGTVSRDKTVPSGRVLVDGLGVGDVGSVVLRDRKHLSQDGLLVVVATVDTGSCEIISGPDMISRGFVYVKEAEDLMNDAKALATRVLENFLYSGDRRKGDVKLKLREELSRMMFQRTKRSPMIIPVIMEI